MEVITIGHASIDLVKSRNTWVKQLGGAAIYTAMAAKIFSDTGVVSRVGMDFSPGFYSILREAGVDTYGMKKVRGKSTTFKIEYDEAGIASYGAYELNVGVHIRPEDIPNSYLRADAFHLSPMAASKQGRFIQFLRKKTMAKISMNTHIGYFSKYRREILKLIPRVDVFALNDEEAKALTRTKSLSHALKAFKKKRHNIIIITTGPGASVILENGETSISHTQYQARVVDLTGCGDAYAGAFISSLLHAKDPIKSANIANSVASIAAMDWNLQAIKNLEFTSLSAFQEYVVARQRRHRKKQRSIEHFL
ncbi:MAG: carbohydrate kinase family protein [Candidatus Hydrothermarchaeota archaeon]|nr:carbohydrate kinase family protein [Candidatus Hydrothermarchaeota archaeon]